MLLFIIKITLIELLGYKFVKCLIVFLIKNSSEYIDLFYYHKNFREVKLKMNDIEQQFNISKQFFKTNKTKDLKFRSTN